MAIPAFAIEIPLLGSLANIVGLFLGTVVSGVIGAIVMYLIDKLIEKKMLRENDKAQIDKGNEVLCTQYKLQILNEVKFENTKTNTLENISSRHREAAKIMKESLSNIMEDFVGDFSDKENKIIIDEEDIKTNEKIDKASKDLDDLLKSWN